jgi:hypothetical protein
MIRLHLNLTSFHYLGTFQNRTQMPQMCADQTSRGHSSIRVLFQTLLQKAKVSHKEHREHRDFHSISL